MLLPLVNQLSTTCGIFTKSEDSSLLTLPSPLSMLLLPQELTAVTLYLMAYQKRVLIKLQYVLNSDANKNNLQITSSNCIIMKLQEIGFIQLQGNDILVNCHGNTDLFKEHTFIHKKL